jgi:hypothetical protein
MVVGEQTWELGGWRRSSTPVPMISANTFSMMKAYKSEDTVPPKLGSGERLTDEGYITNAPLELGDDDYVHRMFLRGEDAWWDFDSSWTSKCFVQSTSGYRIEGRYVNFRTKMQEDLKFTGYQYGEGCDTEGNHYWIDETQGPFTQGCSDSEADNYIEGVNYAEDSLCVYTCNDPNRLVSDDGKCGDCNEGYGLNDDGVCEAGISTKLSNSLRNLPYGLIGGSIALLVGAKYWMSKRG